ncbi:TlpA family protein disulfide reductase [bacterium]|nr:TlpA family protein disulfide reductase [bacterium]
MIGLTFGYLCCFCPIAAWAYKANPGARAANFKGYDIVNHRSIELEDYLGKWVLVEFWASWCGPCIHELPNMIEQTTPYVEAGELAVITVSVDEASYLGDLKKAIRKHNIPYPVIYDGGAADNESGWNTIPAMEWGVGGIPASYLINPQGVIVATELRGSMLADTLDFYIHGNRPVMGLSGHHRVHDDGSVSIYAEVYNPGRGDVEVELYTYQDRMIWDELAGSYVWDTIYADELIESATVSFYDFSETTHEFLLPADENLYMLIYYLKAIVPGSESIGDVNDPGIRLFYNGDSMLLLDVENVNGKYIIHR